MCFRRFIERLIHIVMLNRIKKFIEKRRDDNLEYAALGEVHEDNTILDEIYRFEKDEMDNTARSAASLWCRCYKCDGIINETGNKCEKPNCTCSKWYDAYKGALIALK